ncbi:MAG: ATP-binding protein [Gemmataceae bacterium]
MAERDSMHVLVIEDDRDARDNLCDILELDDHAVIAVGSAAEALDRKDWSPFGAIILDRRLPDASAEELLPRLRQLAPQANVIIVTGYSDLQGAIAALRLGAVDYIIKPINADALRATLHRLAERQRLTRDKERSEARFRSLLEAVPCMIVILRPDHSILYLSPFAQQLTGYSAAEVLGKDYLSLFLDDPRQTEDIVADIQKVLAGAPTRGFENPIRCKDGTQRWMIWNAQPIEYEGAPAVLAVGQDLTSVKRAQDKALQSERLAAIGQMVTGLAHESGNALARSQACLEMLGMEVEDRPEANDLIARIQNALDHLRHLYEEVRGYAAPLKLDREVWDLSALWRQAWKNLTVTHKERDAALHEQAEGLDLHCAVDYHRIDQVFRNILENALAACADPVHVEVQCSPYQLGQRDALRLAFRDNGPGLNAEQKQRIFEPFFTTKTKGTGLGMAIARRIVEAHGGEICVGTPATGAEIVVTLPREAT